LASGGQWKVTRIDAIQIGCINTDKNILTEKCANPDDGGRLAQNAQKIKSKHYRPFLFLISRFLICFMSFHPQALVDPGAVIGARTRVWAFGLGNGVVISEACNRYGLIIF
jgi:hypothetical protein